MINLLEDILAFIVTTIEILLTLRLILKLLAANTGAAFVNWIYETTQPLLQPFLVIFPTPAIKGGYILEFTTLFALFVYAFGGYVLQRLLNVFNTQESQQKSKK